MTDDFERSGAGESARETLRSYGRRKGHRLSPHKSRLMETWLPALRLDLKTPAPKRASLFPNDPDEVWLEIGFGAGEHLIWQAQHNPGTGLIGCEPFVNGMAALLSKADEEGLSNIRLHDGDAREVLAWLPDRCLDRVFVLFPDPWPKKRHQKRRLFNEETAAEIARVLKPGGELRFGSDWADYLEQAIGIIEGSGQFDWQEGCRENWRERPDDWPQTRYEQKAKREGRACGYLRFERRA